MAGRSSAGDDREGTVMTKLLVNFSADRLVFNGPVTGNRYEYFPAKTNGETEVDDADVEELLKITRKEGCRCNEKDGGEVQVHEYHLFELLPN